MEIFDWILIGVAAVFVALTILFVRREWIARGGSIELSIRLSTYADGRGWSPGIARFVGDEMHWYRVFSLALRPRRILNRQMFAVQQRRHPDQLEQRALPGQMVVLRCISQREPVEIAMAETTVTGFMSWLEAAPPGGASTRYAAR
ncbi:MAG TPA: DUF2550 domain-containing protein [Micromonosporaceae bacterium]|jgi:hypothetical protein